MMAPRIVGLLVCVLLVSGCKVVFESDRDGGTSQLYSMWEYGLGTFLGATKLSDHTYPEWNPDASPDGMSIAFVSTRSANEQVLIRTIDDRSGATESVLVSGPEPKFNPRWSCQQDFVAYAQRDGSGQSAIFSAPTATGGSSGIRQLTHPGAGETDSGGHALFDNGNKLVFSRRNPGTNSFDLYTTSTDGTGTPTPFRVSAISNELLPTVSQDGLLLAYLTHVPLGPGHAEQITIVDLVTSTVHSAFMMQPPLGGRKIRALAFSPNSDRLLVATVSDPALSGDASKLEIYRVSRDGTSITQRTTNTVRDSHPSGVPRNGPLCMRCMNIAEMFPTAAVQEIRHNDVVIKAAVYSSGSPGTVQVKDYTSPYPDGTNEVTIDASSTNTGSAEYASINFPEQVAGGGLSRVEVTGFTYGSFRMEAHDATGALVTSAAHTAGQSAVQTVQLSGAGITRVDVIGSEIGINRICYGR